MLAVDRLEEDDFALPVRRQPRARPAPAPARRASQLREVGGGVIGRLEEADQHRASGIGRRAHLVIGQDEFAERLVEPRRVGRH